MTTLTSRKAVLTSIFKRRGANGQHTRLFEDLDPKRTEALLGRLQLGEGELPILGSDEGPDRWLVLTSHRIVWQLGERVETLLLTEIVDVSVDLEGLRAAGKRKREMNDLRIVTRSGERTIGVEAGPPLIGIWSVLRNIAARNRRT